MLLKNLLLLIKSYNSFLQKQRALTCLLLFSFLLTKAQIVNYVNNGGFEECINCSQSFNPTIPKYWNATDTGKFFGILLTKDPPTGLVPKSSYTYQWPVRGRNYLVTTLLNEPNTSQTGRGYPRNRLKQTLQAGHIYCVKFYYNVTNESSYAINALGAYFGDNTLDTILLSNKPISYLTPQIQYTGGLITDTLNWAMLTGTFTANGTEKYMMLGNFKSDLTTNTVMINPTHAPAVFSDMLFDDVSVIDINLPAFAGRDTFFIPGDSIYLGRPRDVGIDEACMWYKLPNTTTAIDTVAGLWIKPTTTCTYVVKQDICGVIKWDTVVLYQSAIGINELRIKDEELRISPNPGNGVFDVEILNTAFTIKDEEIIILNVLGQQIKKEKLLSKKQKLHLEEFENGIYFITISNSKNENITKKLVVAR